MAKGKGKGGTMKVTVTIVPTEGKTTTKSVNVKKTGATVGEILAQAGISADKKDILVNGEPATTTTHVGATDALELKEQSIRVAERPQGS